LKNKASAPGLLIVNLQSLSPFSRFIHSPELSKDKSTSNWYPYRNGDAKGALRSSSRSSSILRIGSVTLFDEFSR